MMLPADLALLEEPDLRQYVELFASDEQAFFDTFAAAYGKVCFLSFSSLIHAMPSPATKPSLTFLPSLFSHHSPVVLPPTSNAD
jgi:hypothetical protein